MDTQTLTWPPSEQVAPAPSDKTLTCGLWLWVGDLPGRPGSRACPGLRAPELELPLGPGPQPCPLGPQPALPLADSAFGCGQPSLILETLCWRHPRDAGELGAAHAAKPGPPGSRTRLLWACVSPCANGADQPQGPPAFAFHNSWCPGNSLSPAHIKGTRRLKSPGLGAAAGALCAPCPAQRLRIWAGRDSGADFSRKPGVRPWSGLGKKGSPNFTASP